MPPYKHIEVPEGEKVTIAPDGLPEPIDHPIIGFIEGDGVGPDIWAAAQAVFDAAVKHCYGGKRSLAWMELYAGEKAHDRYGEYLPSETLDAIREYELAIKGPLTTPVGEGFRSLNVSLRQTLDLFACVRPVRYFDGVPSPVVRPHETDMVVFRENTEDVYSGLEAPAGSDQAEALRQFCVEQFGWKIPDKPGLGLKPISERGSKRLVRAAINYALRHERQSVTLVHKGNIMKFTEGAFRRWGYEVVKGEFSDVAVSWEDCNGKPGGKLLVKDAITDSFLQQILTRPKEYDIIATMNLNGDYISDALAAQVGGIGIAPGANINYETGAAVFEATHGSAPKYTNQDKVNPSSVILSGVMMFDHLGWGEVAEAILAALGRTYQKKTVTYDFARMMEGAQEVKCSEFGRHVIDNLDG